MPAPHQLKRVYWFTHYPVRSASVRYRGWYPLQYLKQHYGVRYILAVPQRNMAGAWLFASAWLGSLLSPSKTTLIVIQKVYSNGLYAFALKALVRLKTRNTVYDTDDADHLRYPTRNIHYFMRHCRTCVVGSQALANYTKQWNSRVKVITSPVISHDQFHTERHNPFVVGWVGDLGFNRPEAVAYSHRTSLFALVFPAIRKLTFPVKLIILGVKVPDDRHSIEAYFKDHAQVSLEIPDQIDWLNEEGIYQRIKEFDVGLAPMVDHPFNVAKSAFKVKQYFSCGVPVLASPVGENKRFVEHGVNGFVCDSPGSFGDYLHQLHAMSGVDYERMCLMGRARNPTFSMDHYTQSLLELHQSSTN